MADPTSVLSILVKTETARASAALARYDAKLKGSRAAASAMGDNVDKANTQIEQTGKVSRQAAPGMKVYNDTVNKTGSTAMRSSRNVHQYGNEIERTKTIAQDASGNLGVMDVRMRQTATTAKRGRGSMASFGHSMIVANQSASFLGKTLSLLKFPAMIALSGSAAQAISALTAGVAGLSGELAPAAGLVTQYGTALGTLGQVKAVFALSGLKNVTSAVGGLNTQIDKSSTYWKKLNPQAQKFAETIDALQSGPLTKLQNAIQKPLFTSLNKAIDSAKKNMPAFTNVLTGTAKAIGTVSERIGKLVGSKSFGRQFQKFGNENNSVLTKMGNILAHLAKTFLTVMVAARPLTNWIFKGIEGWSKYVMQSTRAAKSSGALAQFFNQTEKTTSKLVKLVGDLGTALWNIIKLGQPLGQQILNKLVQAADSFRQWTESAKGQNTIAAWFEKMKAPLFEAGRLLHDIVIDIFKLGAAGQLTNLLHMLRTQLLPIMYHLAAQTSKAFGPGLIKLLVQVGKLIGTFAGVTGPLRLYIDALTGLLRIVNKLFKAHPLLATVTSGFLEFAAVLKTIQFAGAITGITKLTEALFGLAAGETAASSAGEGGMLSGLLGKLGLGGRAASRLPGIAGEGLSVGAPAAAAVAGRTAGGVILPAGVKIAPRAASSVTGEGLTFFGGEGLGAGAGMSAGATAGLGAAIAAGLWANIKGSQALHGAGMGPGHAIASTKVGQATQFSPEAGPTAIFRGLRDLPAVGGGLAKIEDLDSKILHQVPLMGDAFDSVFGSGGSASAGTKLGDFFNHLKDKYGSLAKAFKNLTPQDRKELQSLSKAARSTHELTSKELGQLQRETGKNMRHFALGLNEGMKPYNDLAKHFPTLSTRAPEKAIKGLIQRFGNLTTAGHHMTQTQRKDWIAIARAAHDNGELSSKSLHQLTAAFTNNGKKWQDQQKAAAKALGVSQAAIRRQFGDTDVSASKHYNHMVTIGHGATKQLTSQIHDSTKSIKNDNADQMHSFQQVTNTIQTQNKKQVNSANQTKDKVSQAAQKQASNVSGSFHNMNQSINTGLTSLQNNTNSALKALGLNKPVQFRTTESPVGGTKSNPVGHRNTAQRGGMMVGGRGDGDKVPAMLEPGEFVLNREAVRAAGSANLRRFNRDVPRFKKGGLVYPVPGAGVSRPDQGKDFFGTGPIKAMGAAKILFSGAMSDGWAPSGVVYRLLGGAPKGVHPSSDTIFNYEHLAPTVKAGQTVRAGQTIAQMTGGVEIGFAAPGSMSPLTPYNGAPDGTAMPGGLAMEKLLAMLSHGAFVPGGGSMFKKIKRQILQGPPGPLTDMGQATLDKVRNQANKMLRKKAMRKEGSIVSGSTPNIGKAGFKPGDTISGPVSWFNSGEGAFGLGPGPGIALDPWPDSGWNDPRITALAGSMWKVRIGNHSANLMYRDKGPAIAGRKIDVTGEGVRKLGMSTSSFPTDSIGSATLIKAMQGGLVKGGMLPYIGKYHSGGIAPREGLAHVAKGEPIGFPNVNVNVEHHFAPGMEWLADFVRSEASVEYDEREGLNRQIGRMR